MAGTYGRVRTPRRERGGAPEKAASASDEPRLTRIAKRAREILERRRRADGEGFQHWLEAEREIDNDASP